MSETFLGGRTKAGGGVNSGVGFAIPSSIVSGRTINVRGRTINVRVVSDGPAAKAGLQGSSGTRQVDGFDVPVGGDVVIAAGGERVVDFDDLLIAVASKNPGDTVELTILRDGEEQQVAVTLEARP